MSQSEDPSIERRLERIESSVFQIKVILLVTLVVLVIGVFGPKALVEAFGGTLIVVLIGFCIVYAFLLLMSLLLKWKMGSEEEREARMKEKILASITPESGKNDPAE